MIGNTIKQSNLWLNICKLGQVFLLFCQQSMNMRVIVISITTSIEMIFNTHLVPKTCIEKVNDLRVPPYGNGCAHVTWYAGKFLSRNADSIEILLKDQSFTVRVINEVNHSPAEKNSLSTG